MTKGLTGQCEGDVLKIVVADIRNEVLPIRQNKTKTPLRIPVIGQLKAVVERILARPDRKASTLIQTANGQ